jgi:hypothetical protein
MGSWVRSHEGTIIHRDWLKKTARDMVIFSGENTRFSNTSVHLRKTAVIQLNFSEDKEGNEILHAEEETFTFLESKEE